MSVCFRHILFECSCTAFVNIVNWFLSRYPYRILVTTEFWTSPDWFKNGSCYLSGCRVFRKKPTIDIVPHESTTFLIEKLQWTNIKNENIREKGQNSSEGFDFCLVSWFDNYNCVNMKKIREFAFLQINAKYCKCKPYSGHSKNGLKKPEISGFSGNWTLLGGLRQPATSNQICQNWKLIKTFF